MKKNFLSLTLAIIVIGMASCKSSSSSSFESDVKKMADYRCKAQQLKAKDPADEKAKKELEEVTKEMDSYREKMSKKYEAQKDDKTMNDNAEKIMAAEMAKCK